MSDYPMLISNKLHSFRNFGYQRYDFFAKKTRIRQRITYILVKYHLRKAAVFQN